MEAVIAFCSTVILLPIRLSGIFYACKWVLTYISISVYKRLKESRLGFYDLSLIGQPERVGFLSHPNEIQMESPQSELHLTKADDGIFFYGVSSKGDFLIISIARLCNQKAEATVYLRLASGKVYELTKKSDFQQSSADKNAFTCGGIQAYYLSPMKRWRIFYSGYLQETSEETPDHKRMTYVKFAFLWRASSDVYDNTSDLKDSSIVGAIAQEGWKHIVPPTHKLFNILDFYAQAGVIMGTVSIEDTSESHEIYLFGERVRFLGDVLMSKEIEFCHVLGYVHKNGMYLHLGQASMTTIAKNVNFGFVIKPTGSLKQLKKLDISMKSDSSSKPIQEVKATITADRSYVFCGSVIEPTVLTSNDEKSISMNQVDFFLDGNKGTGICIKGKYNVSSNRKESEIVSPVDIPECVYPMVVAFTEDLCQLPEITGGKGSSLGKLTSLSRELQSFMVPIGVVVTTSSYKRFINADILNEIKYLEEVLYGNKEGDPKEASERVCDKIISTKLPNPVIDNIVKNLHKIFGDDFNSVRYAIRSSATGEDTEQMSAAGQMETLLGVTSLNSILLAVKKCWASQFGFTAIQYKKRYGQCLNTPMAVVIQEMVACDVAGVIFTCDPVTGNSSKMSIAANFGLGESVVSAAVEPDAIELARDANDELTIHSITAGEKSHRVVLLDEGTTLEENPENQRKESCLSSEDIFRLGKLAIKIEKHYRSKRDIEWGIKTGSLFLFQSRPVTSGTQENDFEIEHEFDAALRVENDHYSVSNAAEVLPGAMPPLSRDTLFKQNLIAWQGQNASELQNGLKYRYFDSSWLTMSNHAMFNIADIFFNAQPNQRSNAERASMLGFFGRILDMEEVFEIAYDRFHEERKPAWKSISGIFKSLLFSGGVLKKTQKYYAHYRIPVENFLSSRELFEGLMLRCCDTVQALLNLLVCTQSSSIWNMFMLTVLCQDKEDIDTNIYTDFSKLVTVKGGVESAEVPAAIENLALLITKSITPEAFKAMKTEEALRWLQETPSEAGKMFSEFLAKHGHRCCREFDIYFKTWGTEPESIVRQLQKFVGTISRENVEKENTGLIKEISQLKTALGRMSKLKLLIMTPLSRRAVRHREAAKSLMVKVVDGKRKATWELAKRMVSEGRIPNENILFFMTLDEIRELFNNRSPKVLAKAYQRQRLYPKMDKYRFPEIMKGIPKPINESEDAFIPVDGNHSMKGIPVSQGVAKGYLRVAITLDEAADLKPGEILLAYGTDIGWTSYFPSLAGVATELGGLISHGAVVSREYGLPCVAGLHGAIKRFQTGDYVLLDGNKGILQKIPPPTE